MNRSHKIFLFIFLLLLGILTYLKMIQPEPVNWNPGYRAQDKIPLGTYVLFENIDAEFEVQKVNIPPFNFIEKSPSGTYIFINNILNFDDAELEKLLEWTARGNTLFLVAGNFSENLRDTLNFEIKTAVPEENISSKPLVNLVQKEFKAKEPYLFDHDTFLTVFSEIDTLNSTVLGISQLMGERLEITDPEINFLKMNFGKGSIFLNTTPEAFSNFFLLSENNYQYAEQALAYLPSEKVFWDEYYKSGKIFQTSSLYILLENESLKWAYYFVIFGSIIFILFKGKRMQRSIPVVTPLKNQTLNFTRTIAGLYLEKREYKTIASKKINLFLEHVRNKFRISTSERNEKFYEELSAASGNSLESIKELFRIIGETEEKETITKENLLELNSAINAFKNKKDGK